MRTEISEESLLRLVDLRLRSLTGSGCNFTAYNVTCSLRRQHPQTEISHARVRLAVHRLMRYSLATGLYRSTRYSFGSNRAILYEPVPRENALNLPLLSLN